MCIKNTSKLIVKLIFGMIFAYLWYTYFWQFGEQRFGHPIQGIAIGVMLWVTLVVSWVAAEAFLEYQRNIRAARDIKNLRCPHESYTNEDNQNEHASKN